MSISFYRRNLPHWQPDAAEFFVTFRLAGSLPANAIDQIKAERMHLGQTDKNKTEKQRRIFAKYEQLLDKRSSGPTWLSNKAVAQIVCEAIHYRDQTEYDLYAYCLMPNHIHAVFKLLRENKSKANYDYPVTKILQGLKRYTAVKCNKILGRKGQFWQHESFDRFIREGEELENTIKYVLYNPVKAGLTDQWQNWSYTYCKPDFLDTFT